MTADERGNLQTRKARFLTAIRGGQPDRAPMFDFLFQQPLYEELIGHRPGTYNARDAVACAGAGPRRRVAAFRRIQRLPAEVSRREHLRERMGHDLSPQ